MANKYIQGYQTMNGVISASPKIWYLYILIYLIDPRKKTRKISKVLTTK